MMTMEVQHGADVPPSIPPACLKRLGVAAVRYLGGRANQHWLVETSKSQLVLRRYAQDKTENARYEHEVLRRLHRLGWPVPELVEAPIYEANRLWCLFTLLPGNSISKEAPEAKRSRGRLLAQLHESTASLTDMGQREGFCKSEEVVFDPALLEAIRSYERLRPDVGHLLHWHLDKTREQFGRIVWDDVETIVLHSDFTPWNLLFERGKLAGILDFESTHLNYRVADFALSWRGYQHEVIEGYEEVHPLSERDYQFLVPVYWSWLFGAVKEEIAAMGAGSISQHDFEWPVRQLLRRSALHSIEPYPGFTSHHTF